MPEFTGSQAYPGVSIVGQDAPMGDASQIGVPAQAAPAMSAGDLLMEFTAGDLVGGYL